MRKLITIVMALLVATSAYAESIPPEGIEARLAALEKEVQLLRRLQEVNKEVQVKKDTETPVVVAGKDGFALKSKDQSFQLKLKGQVQADARYFIDDDTSGGANTYLPRRARPILEGTVFKYFDFRLMPDFGSGTTSLQDAWVDFKYWPQASLRVGKFKSPVGLERLQSDPVTQFVETALSTNLVPNRDNGIDLHGDLLNSTVSYDLGVFNGVVDNGSGDTDNHDDKEFVGRIFTQPFKNSIHDALNGFGIGIGSSFGQAHGSVSSPNLPSYRTFGQQSFFSYRSDGTAAGTVFADGARYRIAPQAYYYYGPFGALTELVFSSQRLARGNNAGTLAQQKGGQVALNYVFTGENASYNGVVPRDNFDPKNDNWGAFEGVTRISWLAIDKDNFNVFANPASSAHNARAWTIGLNWYLNKNLKFMTDFEQTFFTGGNAAGGNRPKESALLTRAQIVF